MKQHMAHCLHMSPNAMQHTGFARLGLNLSGMPISAASAVRTHFQVTKTKSDPHKALSIHYHPNSRSESRNRFSALTAFTRTTQAVR